MKPDKEKQDRKPERRSEGGQNILWYLIGGAALVIFAVVWVTVNATDRIAYPDLVELIDKGNVETEVRNRTLRYTNIRDVRVQPGAVVGKVDRYTANAIMMRRLSGAGSPMAFGRSRGRLYAQEDIGVTFDDVAGIDEAVEEVREVVDFLRSPEKYQRLGGRIPKGVLLVGPPGTGKTLLAKAIAGEAGVPFFSLSGSDFVEMFVGVGAARVRDMFQQAEPRRPASSSSTSWTRWARAAAQHVGGHDEREQTLNALLVEMDGFDSNSGVIVMAATNRPETLDPALLRPGRFDRHVLVDRPDIAAARQILKVHVKNVKLDSKVDLQGSPRSRPASSAPTWRTWSTKRRCWPPARASRRGHGRVQRRRRARHGRVEKKQRVMMRRRRKQRVAYHESGARAGGLQPAEHRPGPQGLDHPPRLAALGYTMQRPEGDRFLMTNRNWKAASRCCWPARWPRR
jgi:cell division protease FtsH